MAAQVFVLRVQTEDGTFLIKDLNESSSLSLLKEKLSVIRGIPSETIRILIGYPPRAIMDGNDNATLNELGISSGETLRIQTISDNVLVSDAIASIPANPVLDAGGSGDHSAEFENVLLSGAGILMRHVVPSDNSCLFFSIYYLLSNGELNSERSSDLRRIIAKVVSTDPERYNSAFLGMSNRDYCVWIQNHDHWGGAIELAILSEHFGIEIVAVDTISGSMHRFGENENYINRIILIYDGIHYDPLVLELGDGTKQTIFPVSDGYPLEMALEVAREAKSSRQFTDVANFTIRCMICDVRLRGDAEARSHAVETGHVNFGEI